MRASWLRKRLDFRFTAVTSRDRLTWKDTYYIKVWDKREPSRFGIGEAGLFRSLSCDDVPDYETRLDLACREIERYVESTEELAPYPSIRFGIETALRDLAHGGSMKLFDTHWSHGQEGILINGLIWMGDHETMHSRILSKLADGFTCIKVKIGGIDFDSELELLTELRRLAPDVTIRLDANGAFGPDEALSKLDALARFDIHSIEQPLRQGQWREMREVCCHSPIPVALDEELIGLHDRGLQSEMLETISPAYIILKPTLTGGFASSDQWITLAEERGIGWWATSALESDIGLNAIAQWVATHDHSMPQGLGTGQLYSNNIPSPLTLKGERLWLDPDKNWSLDF